MFSIDKIVFIFNLIFWMIFLDLEIPSKVLIFGKFSTFQNIQSKYKNIYGKGILKGIYESKNTVYWFQILFLHYEILEGIFGITILK